MACRIWRDVDLRLRSIGMDPHSIRTRVRECHRRKELPRYVRTLRSDFPRWLRLRWRRREFASTKIRRTEIFWWTGIPRLKTFGWWVEDRGTDLSTGRRWVGTWLGV